LIPSELKLASLGSDQLEVACFRSSLDNFCFCWTLCWSL